MAISDVDAYAHLTPEQVAELGAELEKIRAEVVESLGERDFRYIHSVIRLQRGLEVGARARAAWYTLDRRRTNGW